VKQESKPSLLYPPSREGQEGGDSGGSGFTIIPKAAYLEKLMMSGANKYR
jgi:hypothetical protein